MTWLLVALVAAGAAVGAPLRYLTDRAVQSRHDTVFPWGTLTVNVVGSGILGAVAGASSRLDPAVAVGLGVGLCGALTTYSTFGYETLQLLQARPRFYAAANVIAGVFAGVGAAVVGFALGAALI